MGVLKEVWADEMEESTRKWVDVDGKCVAEWTGDAWGEIGEAEKSRWGEEMAKPSTHHYSRSHYYK